MKGRKKKMMTFYVLPEVLAGVEQMKDRYGTTFCSIVENAFSYFIDLKPKPYDLMTFKAKNEKKYVITIAISPEILENIKLLAKKYHKTYNCIYENALYLYIKFLKEKGGKK